MIYQQSLLLHTKNGCATCFHDIYHFFSSIQALNVRKKQKQTSLLEESLGFVWLCIALSFYLVIPGIRLHCGKFAIRRVPNTGVAYLIDTKVTCTLSQDNRFDKTVDKKTGYKTRNILCMPIMDQGQRVSYRDAGVAGLWCANPLLLLVCTSRR